MAQGSDIHCPRFYGSFCGNFSSTYSNNCLCEFFLFNRETYRAAD
ncbi:MAG: hypothetical protein KAU58_02380 [Candidatus Omnitrophica bacterium]|nr:hypothetical protein [Candidatus Omnitrophota bacterium]